MVWEMGLERRNNLWKMLQTATAKIWDLPPCDNARFCRVEQRRAGRAGRLAGRGANSARGRLQGGARTNSGAGREWQGGANVQLLVKYI